MKIKLLLIVFVFCVNLAYNQKTNLIQPNGTFVPKTIILKVNNKYRILCENNKINIEHLNNLFHNIGVTKLSKLFPHHNPPLEQINKIGQKLADLSLIYEIKYSSNTPENKVIQEIISTNYVEYAVLRQISNILYVPNDPNIIAQYYLRKIKAYEAWNISKGDSNMVIGIIDTGLDFEHPELVGKVKHSLNDTIDGIDNDGDNYIDNYMGWDMGDNDNFPSIIPALSSAWHGTWVAGLAAASTDNSIGMAGCGFNCMFLPIKYIDSIGNGTQGYESIVYAADHGCKVINCSWGDIYHPGGFGQDVIDYATINKDVLVIAACGNQNDEVKYYPASLNYVLSIAATDSNDTKANFSTYNSRVDVTAPGHLLFSTWSQRWLPYLTSGGTSGSAPIVAGCAGIIRSYFQNYNALQTAERIRISADNIDTLILNSSYKYKLGQGRMNLLNALIMNEIPSIRLLSHSEVDGNDQVFVTGDTLSLKCNFINYLDSSGNIKVILSSNDTSLIIIDSVFTIGSIATLNTINNFNNPFKVLLKNGHIENTNVEFMLRYKGVNYNAFEFFNVAISQNYLNIDTNKISATFSGTGSIGFLDDYKTFGIGFKYNNGESLLYKGSFMAGDSSNRVSDNIYGSIAGSMDNDFKSVSTIKSIKPPQISDFDAIAYFNDDNAIANKLSISVKNRLYAWSNNIDENYIITEYTITNNNISCLQNFYAGLFMDWDIENAAIDTAYYDSINKIAIAHQIGGNVFTGIKPLGQTPVKCYIINCDGSDSTINIYDGFSTNEKYFALSNNHFNSDTAGKDIACVISRGPFTLNANDSIKILFALIANQSVSSLLIDANAADNRFDSIKYFGILDNNISNYSMKIFPNPSVAIVNIKFYSDKFEQGNCSVFDINGSLKMKSCINISKGLNQLSINTVNFKNGIYIIKLQSSTKNEFEKISIIH